MVTAVHASSFPDGTYGGVPCGFIIEYNDKCIYYAGDTGLTLEMKLIAEEFNVNAAILPIGDQDFCSLLKLFDPHFPLFQATIV